MVVDSIRRYFTFGVTTDYQIIYESPTEMPAITICNLNPFNKNYSFNNSDYIRNILVMHHITPELNVTSNEYAITVVENAASLIKAAVTADYCLSKKQKIDLGFTIDRMIIRLEMCYFSIFNHIIY